MDAQLRGVVSCPAILTKEGYQPPAGIIPTALSPVLFQSMLRQPGENNGNAWNMTGEIANKYVLMLVFLLHLSGGKKNLSPRQVLENKELIRLTGYCLGFYCGAQTGQATQTRFHGALQAKYNFQ